MPSSADLPRWQLAPWNPRWLDYSTDPHWRCMVTIEVESSQMPSASQTFEKQSPTRAGLPQRSSTTVRSQRRVRDRLQHRALARSVVSKLERDVVGALSGRRRLLRMDEVDLRASKAAQ